MKRTSFLRQPALVLSAIWLTSALVTWGIVENPFYDLATFLHATERCAQGNIVYRDFQWMYPPLPLHVFALIAWLFPSSYAALNAAFAMIALVMLCSAYALARSLLRPCAALPAALAVYLCYFVASCPAGPSFIGFGFGFLGPALFSATVALIALDLRPARGRRGHMSLSGLLAGLCLLVKHEQIAGVLAISTFLLLRRLLLKERATDFRLLPFFAFMLAVAGLGYGITISMSGWPAFAAAFTGYGTAAEHALRNIPSVVTLWLQSGLLFLHVGVALAVAAMVQWNDDHGVTIRRTAGLAVLCLIAGLGIFTADSWRMYSMAVATDWSTVKEISGSLASCGMMARGTGPVTASLQYIGGVVCRNILPVMVIWFLIGAFLVRTIWVHLVGGHRVSSRLQVATLFWFALGGIQVRGLFSYSSYGVFEFALPLLVFLLPHASRHWITGAATPRLARRFRLAYTGAWLIPTAIMATALYIYEFRDARVHPLALDTDKGCILLPNTPVDRAFLRVVAYVRTNHLENVLAVPFDGVQFWTGHAAPQSWLGLLHPAIFHEPWVRQLDVIEKEEVTFIVFEQLDTCTLTFPCGTSWFDGPVYRPYRWKEAFPTFWQSIRNDCQLLATFEEQGVAYFSVYRSRTLTPGGRKMAP